MRNVNNSKNMKKIENEKRYKVSTGHVSLHVCMS